MNILHLTPAMNLKQYKQAAFHFPQHCFSGIYIMSLSKFTSAPLATIPSTCWANDYDKREADCFCGPQLTHRMSRRKSRRYYTLSSALKCWKMNFYSESFVNLTNDKVRIHLPRYIVSKRVRCSSVAGSHHEPRTHSIKWGWQKQNKKLHNPCGMRQMLYFYPRPLTQTIHCAFRKIRINFSLKTKRHRECVFFFGSFTNQNGFNVRCRREINRKKCNNKKGNISFHTIPLHLTHEHDDGADDDGSGPPKMVMVARRRT